MNNNKAYEIIRGYFSGKLSKKNQNLVKLWLLMSNDADEKDDAMRRIWDVTPTDDCIENTEKSWELLKNRIENYEQKRSRKNYIIKALRYAAVLLLPIITAAVAWHVSSIYYSPTSNILECFVEEGATKTLVLSDSTKVILNGGSRIIFPEKFGLFGNRNVYVEGEAHFDVSHDSRRQFIVNIENLDVKVLGTHFNVRAYRDEENIITTLELGSILVSDGLQNIYLKPNQQAIYNRKTNIITRSNVQAEQESLWTSGELKFESKPLRLIIATIGHKYGVVFNVDNRIDLNKKYTVDFNASENIEDVLNVLNLLKKDNLYFKLNGKSVQLSKKRKEDI